MQRLRFLLRVLLGTTGRTMDSTRRAAKTGVILIALSWLFIFIGGNLIVEASDKSWISPASAWLTLAFVVLTTLFGFWFGGRPLDALIGLRIAGAFLKEEEEAEHGRVRRSAQTIIDVGEAFTWFLRFCYVVTILMGLFFTFIPVGRDWGLFGALALAWIGFLISGAHFLMERWHKVLTFACFLLLGLAIAKPFVTPVYASYRATTIENEIVQPSTSNLAEVISDSPAWLCRGCKDGQKLNAANVSEDKVTIKAGTIVEIANPEPQPLPLRGLNVTMIHRQLANVDEGFEERIYVLPSYKLQRRTRPTEVTKNVISTQPPPIAQSPTTRGVKLDTPGTWTVERLTGKDPQGSDQWATISPADLPGITDTTGVWRVNWPANQETIIPFHIQQGKTIEKILLSGEIKLNEQDNWYSPAEGSYMPDRLPTAAMFMRQDVYAAEAMMEMGGSDWQPIGFHGLAKMPLNTNVQYLVFAENTHKDEIGCASGKGVFTFRIS